MNEMKAYGTRRVGDQERQDVIHHLAACETSGHLEHDEAEQRMDLAREANLKDELCNLVRDLPDRRDLAAMQMHRTTGKKKWLTETQHGRVVLHLSLAVLSLVIMFAPLIISLNDGWHGPAVVIFVAACFFGGLAAVIGDVVYAMLWKGWDD